MIAEMMQDLRAEYERREGEAYTRGREDMRRLVLSFIAHGCGGERCTAVGCACTLESLVRQAAP
jgi:hypothetical protein